jgi:type VI secretion system secreted protein VgrG
MSVDVFSLGCTQLPTAKLVGFKGTEALSSPFEFDLFFTVPAGTDVRVAVGANATLLADRKDGRDPQCWHGVFARLRLLHQTAERALYHGLLVPKLWLLRHSIRSHVSTKENVKQFLTHALGHGSLGARDVDFRIDADKYPVEEFVCQYRESHLDFFHRWLEREGLYYWFEHEPASNGSEVCVIVDDKAKHKPLLGEGKGKVPYVPVAGDDVTAGEGLRELHCDFERLPASVLITDYNYANPAAPVEGTGAVSSTGFGEIRDYGYRVFDENEAGRLAGIKAESIACRELTLHATGNALYLRAGYTFELEDGPEELPKSYLAIEVRHAGSVAGATEDVRRYTGLHPQETYRVELHAIPADVQFRAPQTTPWPRIYGFENAVIDGEVDSPYAQLDDQGRYLVRFKFDASTLSDGKASTYVRMMQPHGGTTEGHHFPLRKGTEIMVAFQGGDPDRPLIAGVVPNAHKPSPITSKNHTKNILRTGGNNHMVIEDLEGKQHIDLYSPQQESNFYLGNPRAHAFVTPPDAPPPPGELGDSTITSVRCAAYLHTYYVDVTGTAKIHYVGIHTLNIDADSNEFYNAHRNTTIATGRNDQVKAGGMVQDIHGGLTQTIEPGGKQEVTGGWTHKVTGQNSEDYGNWDTKAKDGWTMHDSALVSWDIGGTVTIKAKTEIKLLCPKVTIEGAEVAKKASGLDKYWTPAELKFFGTKNAVGVQTTTVAAIKADRNGLKLESNGATFTKYGVKKEIKGLDLDSAGLSKKDQAIKIAKGALNNITFGIVKIG